MRWTLLVFILWLIATPSLAQDTPEPKTAKGQTSEQEVLELLREAHHLQSVRSDVKGALKIYTQVLKVEGLSDSFRAHATVRKAHCLTLLDKWLEAESEFRNALSNFKEQVEAQNFARRYVSRIAKYMPPDADTFIELVEPGQQVDFLRTLIQGTPLENPIDNYLKISNQKDKPGSIAPRPREDQFNSLRALLNIEFLNQLKQIEGLGVSLKKLENEQPDLLAVFQPGTSILSRGVITMLMSFIIVEAASKVEGVSIFKTIGDKEDEKPFYIATTQERDIVFLGSPLSSVENAIRRYKNPDQHPGLDHQADFRSALQARSSSLIFTYLKPQAVTQALFSKNSEVEKRNLNAALSFLGLKGLTHSSLTLSRSGNDLRLNIQGKTKESTPPTQLLNSSFLTPLSSEVLSIAAMSGEDVEARLENLLSKLFHLNPKDFTPLVHKLAQRDLVNLKEKRFEFDDRLQSVQQLAWVLPQVSDDPTGLERNELLWKAFLKSFLKMDAGKKNSLDHTAIQDFLSGVFLGITETALSTQLHSKFKPFTLDPHSSLDHSIKAQRLELTPSLSAYYLFDKTRAWVFMSEEGINQFIKLQGKKSSLKTFHIPVGANSIVMLRPRDIKEAFNIQPVKNELARAFLQAPQATIYTIQQKQFYRLILSISEATPSIKDLLNSLPVTGNPSSESEEEKND